MNKEKVQDLIRVYKSLTDDEKAYFDITIMQGIEKTQKREKELIEELKKMNDSKDGPHFNMDYIKKTFNLE